MAFSCLIGRIFPPALKAHPLTLSKRLYLRPSSSILVTQSRHHQSFKGSNSHVGEQYSYNISKLKCLTSTASHFSTSSSMLSAHKGHDHGKIWSFERFLSAILLPLVPAALINPCQQLDTALALLVVLHTHFGLEAIIVDYVRPIIFGSLVPKIGIGLLYLFSVVTLAGLLNLIYNDMGLANTIVSVWKK